MTRVPQWPQRLVFSLGLKDDAEEEIDEFDRRCAKTSMVDRNDVDDEDVATDGSGKYFGQDSIGLSVYSSRDEPRQIPKATVPIGSFDEVFVQFEKVVSCGVDGCIKCQQCFDVHVAGFLKTQCEHQEQLTRLVNEQSKHSELFARR